METLKQLMNNKSTVLVDVRAAWEYEEAHITGAKNIPLEELSNELETLKNFKKPVILYCQSGNRSGMAVNFLKQNGLSEVYNGGGIDNLKTYVN